MQMLLSWMKFALYHHTLVPYHHWSKVVVHFFLLSCTPRNTITVMHYIGIRYTQHNEITVLPSNHIQLPKGLKHRTEWKSLTVLTHWVFRMKHSEVSGKFFTWHFDQTSIFKQVSTHVHKLKLWNQISFFRQFAKQESELLLCFSRGGKTVNNAQLRFCK